MEEIFEFISLSFEIWRYESVGIFGEAGFSLRRYKSRKLEG